MWDSGLGQCVGCGRQADRDVAGRCEECFRAGVPVGQPYFKEMVKLVTDSASVAHIKDIKARRLDTKTGKMYYDRGERTYFDVH